MCAAALAFGAGCRGTGADGAPHDATPWRPDAPPAADGGPASAATEPGPTTPGASESGAAGTGAAATGAAETAVPAPDARWCLGAGAVARFALLDVAAGSVRVEERTARAVEGGVEIAVAVDGQAAARLRASVADDEVLVALAPDELRDVPPPVRELPRPPTAGAAWDTPAARCVVEETGVRVTTAVGERSGCARVRVTPHAGGGHSLRWFDPELGEVRRETYDRRGRLVAGRVLCSATAPDAAALRTLFGL